jgi:hypothetical protein
MVPGMMMPGMMRPGMVPAPGMMPGMNPAFAAAYQQQFLQQQLMQQQTMAMQVCALLYGEAQGAHLVSQVFALVLHALVARFSAGTVRHPQTAEA